MRFVHVQGAAIVLVFHEICVLPMHEFVLSDNALARKNKPQKALL